MVCRPFSRIDCSFFHSVVYWGLFFYPPFVLKMNQKGGCVVEKAIELINVISGIQFFKNQSRQ